MLRLFRSRTFLFIIITIIILVLMGVTAQRNSKVEWINNLVSVPLSPVQRFFSFVSRQIEAGVSFFKDIKTLKEENEYLKVRISELERENRELIEYRQKNEDLKEALKLKDQFDEYEIIGSNVVAKDPGNWFNVFRIDVGEKDGVSVDFPVLDKAKGLVGRIIASDFTSSKVITILDENNAVSGYISKPGGGPVRIIGDLALKSKGLCRMDYIPVDVDVEVGDIVETSGFGGIYPKGIIIGKVREVRMTNSELDRYAIIEPAVDFKRLEEVFILKNKTAK